MTSDTTARRGAVAGAGDVLRLIRTGRANTRAEVAEQIGLGRAAVSQRLDALLASGYIHPAGALSSTGGRRPALFKFNADAGVVLAAEIGAMHTRCAITDLAGRILRDITRDIAAGDGPELGLAAVQADFEALLQHSGRSRGSVYGIGIGLAAPVEFAAGRAVNPPIMAGWDGFAVASWMRERWNIPVLVDNEVNMMAIGEHSITWAAEQELLAVKVGTGIGCGIISDGQIHRGAQGAAGDIGHIQVAGHEGVVCRCGNAGCLEAVAGGEAMARRLTGWGFPAATSRDVVRLARDGHREAIQLIRESGRLLGHVLAGAVNLLNPSVIVIGGDVAQAEEHLFAGVRETVYQRSLPLATKHLRIAHSELHDRAAVIGAAITVVEHTLTPDAVEATLLGGGPGGSTL